ncbi:hypothetical protein D1AOALGA4SA_10253 [Olavius algarvensis Delta 1 endosymbiont]|nr:hypothetical protein D1AOALGA4SA_10253 [Olavius algarvensis Delta 1 endosymbiont]
MLIQAAFNTHLRSQPFEKMAAHPHSFFFLAYRYDVPITASFTH